MRLNFPSIVVALAIVTCNAYATPADVASKSGRGQNKRGFFLVKSRSSTSGGYDQRRFVQIVGKPVDDVTEQSSLMEQNVSFFANRISSRKITGIALSSVLLYLAVVAAMSPQSFTVYSVRCLEKYKGSMVRFPLQTKVATGATLAVLGDALAQTRDPLQKSYDPRRAASFAAFDGCYRFFQHKAFPFIISICQGGVLGGILSTILGVSLGSNVRLGLAALERTLVYQPTTILDLYLLSLRQNYYYPLASEDPADSMMDDITTTSKNKEEKINTSFTNNPSKEGRLVTSQVITVEHSLEIISDL